jgi:hypothetical protein
MDEAYSPQGVCRYYNNTQLIVVMCHSSLSACLPPYILPHTLTYTQTHRHTRTHSTWTYTRMHTQTCTHTHTYTQMMCTGGIRCDIYSTLLKARGFNNLYTLEGGIQVRVCVCICVCVLLCVCTCTTPNCQEPEASAICTNN